MFQKYKSSDFKERGPWGVYCIFFYKVFVLACLREAQVQAETSSSYVNVTEWIKINRRWVRFNNCG